MKKVIKCKQCTKRLRNNGDDWNVVEGKIAGLRKRSTVLDLVASAEDVAVRWGELSPDRRSAVIGDVVRVTILPAPKGPRVPTQERLLFEGV